MNHGLAHLTPYAVSAGATMPAGCDVLRLDWNEAQVPPSPAVMEALRDGLDGLNCYPDVEATALRAAIGAYVGLPAACIRAYNGSDAALRDVCAAFLSPGDRALVRRPVYTQIDTFLAVQNATAVDWTCETPFGHDLNRHAAELRRHSPALCYICNPSNPTGETYAPLEVGLLAARFPAVLFLVDEAYIEFGGETCAPLVTGAANVLICRTFSKAFGLAGLRLGYAMGNPATLATLDLVRNGKDVNALAQRAGVAALSPAGLAYVRRYVAGVRRAMRWTVERCEAMGLEARETPGNFLLVRVPDAPGLVAALRARGVLVRDRSGLPGMGGWVRVTVGTMEHMERFVTALESAGEGR